MYAVPTEKMAARSDACVDPLAVAQYALVALVFLDFFLLPHLRIFLRVRYLEPFSGSLVLCPPILLVAAFHGLVKVECE